MVKKNVLALIAILGTIAAMVQPLWAVQAKQPVLMNSAELKIALEKLLILGSVLYVAAHPDDENTAVLAYMSRERKLCTGYLSLTRGGGGQNLIGSEKGALMSVIRTNELLKARSIDGAEQFFTRAVDFGFSKTDDESIAIWGEKNILSDMVYIIRKFRPDVLLTRFSTTKGGSGHGHHTASAVLAVEAFHAAGDPEKFPEQLKTVSIWQPKRIFWNSWRPYYGSRLSEEEMAKYLKVDVGKFNQLLGRSYYEIASLSRTMHKSQGFGSVPRRGQWWDYFELLAGEPAKKDLFEGIDLSWRRVKGSQKVRQLLEKANASYKADTPHSVLPLLLEAMAELEAMPKSYWTVQKSKELKEVIRSAAGLWLEATADTHTVTPGQEVNVTAAAINRSASSLTLKKIIFTGKNGKTSMDVGKPLEENTVLRQKFKPTIPEDQAYTHPYWLKEKPGKGIFNAANHGLLGLPVAPYGITVKIVVESGGREVSFETPVLFRWRDPVEGERIRELTVTPPVTANFTDTVFYFPGKDTQTIDMLIRSGPGPVSGTLKLTLPNSWKAEPASLSFDIKEPLTQQRVSFTVTPPAKDAVCDAAVEITANGKIYHSSHKVIQYPHLPILTLHPKAEARFVRVDITRRGQRIGYIMGSGDEIPQYLEQVGFQVDLLEDEELHSIDLKDYDAIITGIRAYNTRDILKHVQKRLLDYVSAGGRLLVQYNVSRGLKVAGIGPYPLELSRGRITEENAVFTILAPKHRLLTSPNRISSTDFNGWVQERGLYFAGKWDQQYTPLLAGSDSGEKPLEGSLLYASYGKGAFVYTGLSFFRQLPAGVPGTLKLFVNLIE